MLWKINGETHVFPIWWSISKDQNLMIKSTHTMEKVWEPISRAFPIQGVLLSFPWYGKTMRKHMTFPYDEVYHMMEIYLFIYFQFIYRWQILFHLIIRLAFHKQQGLSQTSSAINNIVECCYRWHQIFETAPQFVVLIKVNINQCRNAKIRRYAPNWQMTLYQNDLIKTLKIIVNPSAGKGNKGNKNR